MNRASNLHICPVCPSSFKIGYDPAKARCKSEKNDNVVRCGVEEIKEESVVKSSPTSKQS